MEAIKGLFPHANLQKSDSGSVIELSIGYGVATLRIRLTVAAQAHIGRLQVLDSLPKQRLQSIRAQWQSISHRCDFLDPLQPLRAILSLQLWWAKQHESCEPALTAVGIPDDVVDIIFSLLDPVDIMRLGLSNKAWLAQVDRESLWAHLYALSGFSLSSFSLQMCNSSRQKYSLAFQARKNMRQHRANLRPLSDPSVFPNLDWASFLLDASVRVGTSRYIVYHLNEVVQYSSYEARECRGAVFVDLQTWPDNLTQIPFGPTENRTRAPNFAMIGQNRAMSVNDNFFIEIGAENPRPEPELPRFGRHLWNSTINSDARYPWLLHFLTDQFGEDGSKKFIVYDVDSQQIALGPFWTPGEQNIARAGALVGPWIVDGFCGPWVLVTQNFRDYANRIDIFNLAHVEINTTPRAVAAFSRDVFPLPEGAFVSFIIPRLGPNGLLVVAVRFRYPAESQKPSTFALFSWDFSQQENWSESRFLESKLDLTIPGVQIDTGIQDLVVTERYAVVTLGDSSLVVDFRTREHLTVLHTVGAIHNCVPIDSTLFLINTARKLFGVDFARDAYPLPVRVPAFAALVSSNHDTPDGKAVELQFHSCPHGSGRKFFDALLDPSVPRNKWFVDIIEDPDYNSWRIYVVHKLVAAKLGGTTRTTLDKAAAALSAADSGSNSRAVLSASSPILHSTEYLEAPGALQGHSRSGTHPRAPAASGAASASPRIKKGETVEAVAFKIGKISNETRDAFVFCDLTRDEAETAFFVIRARIAKQK